MAVSEAIEKLHYYKYYLDIDDVDSDHGGGFSDLCKIPRSSG